ncbi:MAG: TadG family pilus assembly protein [Parvibaculum sp.]|uniref:TadG family pilus assembly protein n=1 Tax=Parvibaculum sp. TaxID=2024848 RepID=UPI002ABAAA3D|nr:TadG family pilus assembly protein [Parvibaculum sp.]MDZ4380985.1 TadG family pilus assembly protein [Parvibaculum sp.]
MAHSLTGFLRRYARDEDGVISVMAVGALVLALAVAMIVIDTGAMLSAYRNQQAATDAAALGAVRRIAEAQSAAESIFDLNEFPPGDMVATPLYYAADPSRAPDDRFFMEGETASDGTVVDTSSFNAVRVTKRSQSPTYFARLFGFGNLTQIDTDAVAALTKYVSFSAGTRIASLDAGLANQILGGLLSTTVNLSLIDYNALADANIDALEFLDALATEAGLQAGSDTYGDLLEAGVTVGDILGAAVEVLTGDSFEGDPSVATLALQTALSPVGSTPVDLGDVLDLAPIAQRTVGSIGSAPGGDVPFNLFDLVSGTAMALGEGQAVGFDTDVNLGSLASVSGTITVGAPMAHMAVGKVGDSVRTSQVTVQLSAQVSVPLPLLGQVLDIPIYIDAGSGMAEVASIPCITSGTHAVLAATTSAGVIRYGTESSTVATISVPLLLTFQLSGAVPVGASGPTNINFSESEFGEVKSTSSDVVLISELTGATEIEDVTLLGILNLTTPVAVVEAALLSSIAGALAPLDAVVTSLLTTLGIKLGAMDMIVHGAKCRAPTLVS